MGAAAAECERFRWEITGDNPARDGAARQETSSERAGSQLRAKGEGCLGDRIAAGGTATELRAAVPSSLMSPPRSLLFTFQDVLPHARALRGVGKKNPRRYLV